MREKFERYGDVVSFDLTFQMVKNIHQSSENRWKLGVFLGVSSCKHLVPLGIVFTLNQTREAYSKIFRTFFAAVKGHPRILVTDEEKAIGAALGELKQEGDFQGSHRLDLYHILHNVRKKLSERRQVKLFSRIAHARNNPEFQRRVEEAEKLLPASDRGILYKFL